MNKFLVRISFLAAGLQARETEVPATGGASGYAGDWGDGGAAGDGLDEDLASLGAADGEWKDAIDIGIEEASSISGGAAGAGRPHGHLNGMVGELDEEAPGVDPVAAWRQKPIPADLVAAGSPTNEFPQGLTSPVGRLPLGGAVGTWSYHWPGDVTYLYFSAFYRGLWGTLWGRFTPCVYGRIHLFHLFELLAAHIDASKAFLKCLCTNTQQRLWYILASVAVRTRMHAFACDCRGLCWSSSDVAASPWTSSRCSPRVRIPASV